MRPDKYKVVLSSGTYVVLAFNEREAIILAQAEAIKEGRNYGFVSIEEADA